MPMCQCANCLQVEEYYPIEYLNKPIIRLYIKKSPMGFFLYIRFQ